MLRILKTKIAKNRKLNTCILLSLIILLTFSLLKDSKRHRRLVIDTEEIFIRSENKTIIKPKDYVCSASNLQKNVEEKNYFYNPNLRHILIVISRNYRQNKFISNLEKIFYYSRIKFKRIYRFTLNSNEIPSIVIFESYDDYLYYRGLKSPNFELFFQKNNISIIVFNNNKIGQSSEIEFIKCKITNDTFLNNFLYMTKFNTQSFEIKKIMEHNQEFKNIFYDQKISNSILKCDTNNGIEEIMFLHLANEIKHVFIAIESIDEIWLLKSLFIDSLRYLTNGEIDIGLTRHVQIDIDDIFVTKMLPEDVDDLIRLQDHLSLRHFNRNNHKFKFVIGYCGAQYQMLGNRENSNINENKADKLFLGRQN